MVRLLVLGTPFPEADLGALEGLDRKKAIRRDFEETVAYATGVDSVGNGHILRTDTTGRLLLVDAPLGTLATAQVSVTNAGVSIIGANAARLSLLVTNLGTETVYVGNAGVTTANGQAVPAGATLSLPFTGALNGIVTTGPVTVTTAELSL